MTRIEKADRVIRNLTDELMKTDPERSSVAAYGDVIRALDGREFFSTLSGARKSAGSPDAVASARTELGL